MGTTQSSEVKERKKNLVGSGPTSASDSSSNEVYPTPKGNEYDAIDQIAAELPNVIDDESRQQVEDYKQACDNGKGPMVRTGYTCDFMDVRLVHCLYLVLTKVSPNSQLLGCLLRYCGIYFPF